MSAQNPALRTGGENADIKLPVFPARNQTFVVAADTLEQIFAEKPQGVNACAVVERALEIPRLGAESLAGAHFRNPISICRAGRAGRAQNLADGRLGHDHVGIEHDNPGRFGLAHAEVALGAAFGPFL